MKYSVPCSLTILTSYNYHYPCSSRTLWSEHNYNS
uniref:Uncharacterized protein n=1 Tax=Arundo donax TaxID=35708 RepID=A0A0A8ZGC4_ARUDO